MRLIYVYLPRLVGLFGPTNSAINNLLGTVGYPIVALFVAIESVGIPFPGETVLVLAAVYAGTSGKHLSIVGVIASAAIGGIAGGSGGYAAGRLGGRRLVERYGHYIRLKQEHLDRADKFFAKYGDKTVFFGRFVAVLRAWAAFLAGLNEMAFPAFFVYNAAACIVWATVYGILGYVLGSNVFRVVRYLGIAAVVVAVIVLGVAVFLAWRKRKQPTQ